MRHRRVRSGDSVRSHDRGSARRGRPPALRVAWTAFVLAAATAGVTHGCSATGERHVQSGGAGGGSAIAPGAPSASEAGTGGRAAATATATGAGGAGGAGPIVVFFPDAGSDARDDAGATDGAPANACGSECGPVELCDPAHLGLDDNCNGEVDEGCACNPGQLHWCFKGDPRYHNTPGCFDGTEACSELGTWGACTGGVFATAPDNCFQNDTTACHAVSATPFATVDLASGTGDFSANAVAGSESYTVQCPTGVSQCPAVMPPDAFQPLQSGEYTVTYTKSVAGGQGPLTCTFPLFVAAPGLRVELSWEHFTSDTGVDLDLHMHQPLSSAPWTTSPAGSQDCGWANCKLNALAPPTNFTSPQWFASTNVAPDPCNWDDQPNPANNTCYNIPRGIGAQWQALGMGCHNPRLDIDDIQCNISVTNPNDPDFCAPENINVDYVPDRQWFRIAVHYYRNYGRAYDVHPEVKVFYNGQQSADLGPQGFYVPPAPVAFHPADGAGAGVGNRFWVVADIAVTDDGCGNVTCVVQPLYDDPVALTPYLTIDTMATSTFAPPWPPQP